MPRLLPLPRALHTTQRPSATAQWTTLARALELSRPAGERIVTDVYAPVFLSAINRRVLSPLTSAGPLVHVAERSELAGISTSALCRHAFIDAQLLEALPEVDQIVVLGAGYDSRAYRFARAVGARPVFEVDLAPLSRRKAEIVAGHPELFGRGKIERVEIDFRTQSLVRRLTETGFVPGARTFVAWEGVSMYLTRETVLETLHALAVVCGAGSVLAMDFWQDVDGAGPYAQLRRAAVRSMRLIGEPITFTVAADRVGALLGEARFVLDHLLGANRMTASYATGGRVCDEGMFVAGAHLR